MCHEMGDWVKKAFFLFSLEVNKTSWIGIIDADMKLGIDSDVKDSLNLQHTAQ